MNTALYIHLPWCIQKCPYCDFNSRSTYGKAPATELTSSYTEALIKDLQYELPQWQGRSISSIFFGGGTPSLFPAEDIATLLQHTQKHHTAAPEITLEANPGAVDSARFKGYRKAGVNRLSIGAQSFSNQHLKVLGRIHDKTAPATAMQQARDAGFNNINLDIMYGLPQQTPAAALYDLKQAIELQPEHISWYQLTLEENTPFAAKPPPGMPDEEHIAQMEQQGYELLKQAGYERYEISAFSKPDKQCQHNLNYWNFGDYIGIGAGAHGKRTSASTITRTRRIAHPQHYMDAAGTNQAITTRTLNQRDKITEFALNALRLCHGFTEQQFTSTTNIQVTEITKPLHTAIKKGLLQKHGQTIKPTAAGLRYTNETIAIFNN